jgi:hypothetical protein
MDKIGNKSVYLTTNYTLFLIKKTKFEIYYYFSKVMKKRKKYVR